MKLTKEKFRAECLKKLGNLPQNNKVYRDLLVCKQIKEELKNVKGKRILFYYPLKNEADIRKILNFLRKNNKIYIPFMQGKSFKMVLFRLPLEKKRFGIFEAGNTNKKIKNIDIAIVPIVGVDGNLQRVGFGKGMYDRFFARLKKRPYTIFIQTRLCYTDKSVCDNYDVKADVVLTPSKRLVDSSILNKKRNFNVK